MKKFFECNDIIKSTLAGLAATNPITGGIASGWNDYKTNKEIKNIKYILENFSNQLEKLKNKISKEFVESLEAKYLLEKVVFLGKNEIEDEILDIYVEFLINASSKRMFKDKGKKMVLNTLTLVTPLHLNLLKKIAFLNVNYFGLENVNKYDYKYKFPTGRGTLSNLISEETTVEPEELGFKKEEYQEKNGGSVSQFMDGKIVNLLEANLNYLNSIGLIEKITDSSFENISGYYMINGYKLTMLGIKILEYIGYPLSIMEGKHDMKKYNKSL